MRHLAWTMLLVFAGTCLLFAQPGEGDSLTQEQLEWQRVEKLSWRKKLDLADQLFDKGSLYNAIEIYEMSYNDFEDNIDAVYYLGAGNYLIRDYQDAVKWFGKALEVDSTKYPLTRYYYALSLKQTGQYDQAMTEFEKLRNYEPKKKCEYLNEVKSEIDDEVAGCEFGLRSMADPVNGQVYHLKSAVNSPLTDFGPSAYGQTRLIYAALAADSVYATGDTSMDQNKRYSRLYTASKADEAGDEWEQSTLFDVPFNTDTFHVGNGVFSPDKKRFFFTKCSETENLYNMHCKIFYSDYMNGEWQAAVEIPANSDDYSNTHPMYVVDENNEKILYFSSDREDGFGGYDVWYLKEDPAGGFLTEPVNAGAAVNTTKDDVTPYYDTENKTLFFSSNGHVNMGGLDIFSSTKDNEGNMGNAANLGYPINSSNDDLYYRLDGSDQKGYLVSNRPGGESLKSATCCDDILRFSYPPEFVTFSGTLKEENSGTPIDDGYINVYDENDSLVHHTLTPGGNYEFTLPGDGAQYRLIAGGPRHEEEEIAVNTGDLTDPEYVHDFILKKRPYYDGLQFGIVYFEYDKAKLRDEARGTLDSLVDFMNLHSQVIIEVEGHCDSIASDEYNMKLSERRALSVYNYLLAKDIASEQLTYKGYGRSQPIAPNKTPDGKDNPDGRKQNRRCEFTVVGELQLP